ncbi:unnamed protein product [Urochloa humidicola]
MSPDGLGFHWNVAGAELCVGMCSWAGDQEIRMPTSSLDIITLELKLLQSRKVVDARERHYVGDELLKFRTRSSNEVDIGDVGALSNEKVEL